MTWALLGSGEFEPWCEEVDRWLLERANGDGRVLVVPTASAPESDEVFDGWVAKGLAHYASLGIQAEAVQLRTREDAEREDLASMLDGASVAFFSGGNPAYLSATLRGTAFWAALRAAKARGLGYAGCSAGVACLGDQAPDSDANDIDEETWKPGLGVFPGAWFGPHWDALDTFKPGLTEFIVSSVPPGEVLLAIDEETAVVGDGSVWQVMGDAGAHVYLDGDWQHHGSGSVFELELGE